MFPIIMRHDINRKYIIFFQGKQLLHKFGSKIAKIFSPNEQISEQNRSRTLKTNARKSKTVNRSQIEWRTRF